MYNSEQYLLEKQASRRAKPLSRAEMLRAYGLGGRNKPSWLQRSSAWLIAAGQKLQPQAQSKASSPALSAKS